METDLDPINSPMKDETAMNVLRLESRVAGVVDYLARLKVAASRDRHDTLARRNTSE